MSEITLQINGKTQTCLPATKLPQMLENLGMNPRLVCSVNTTGKSSIVSIGKTPEIKEG
jgi:sulfur carrier protein